MRSRVRVGGWENRARMRLTKHHGLGNDFLVLWDLEGRQPLAPAVARALCDRRGGVGADGVMRVTTGQAGADLTMELFNSDGSRAEMSGNGLRCLAQAALRSGARPGPSFTVATPAGLRRVEVLEGGRDAVSIVTADMGDARQGPDPVDALLHAVEPKLAATVSIGNPHLVLLVEGTNDIDAALLGPGYQGQFAATGGINVEWVAPSEGADTLDLIVFERGAGLTQACGTGACAAAWAANRWGLVGTQVSVAMPGGTVQVGLVPTVTLTGPVRFVATVDVEPADLA
jgi:diaminopimelate epimerase